MHRYSTAVPAAACVVLTTVLDTIGKGGHLFSDTKHGKIDEDILFNLSIIRIQKYIFLCLKAKKTEKQ